MLTHPVPSSDRLLKKMVIFWMFSPIGNHPGVGNIVGHKIRITATTLNKQTIGSLQQQY